MKEEYRKQLREFKIRANILGLLRTFPNNKKMPIRESVFLNRLGKCYEGLNYVFTHLLDEKLSRKELKFIDKLSRDLADLQYERELKLKKLEED